MRCRSRVSTPTLGNAIGFSTYIGTGTIPVQTLLRCSSRVSRPAPGSSTEHLDGIKLHLDEDHDVARAEDTTFPTEASRGDGDATWMASASILMMFAMPVGGFAAGTVNATWTASDSELIPSVMSPALKPLQFSPGLRPGGGDDERCASHFQRMMHVIAPSLRPPRTRPRAITRSGKGFATETTLTPGRQQTPP